jgi:predicted alpha/beta-hydrolase family hydrolase
MSGPAPSRLPELVEAARSVPTVVVQGGRDSLGSPDEIADGLAEAEVTARVVPICGADHSFHVPARVQTTTEDALDMVVRAARSTALRIVDGHY